jgi:N-acetylneuraminate synthase
MFVAEISGNHLGSFERAKKLIVQAAESGATAVKLQTYTPDTMTLNLKSFKVSDQHNLWGGKSLYDLYSEAFTPWEWHAELFELITKLGLIPFSTPFDISAVEFLESLNTPIYKIASLESGDHGLIKAIAQTNKPIIASTGATNLEEIDELVDLVKTSGNNDLTLLVCTSAYPAMPKDANLLRLKFLNERYKLKVGLSDHTLGIGVSLAAIALGATVIEKHFTLCRKDGGPDSAFSLEPQEFKLLVEEGFKAHSSLGSRDWNISKSEYESRSLRRSLYIVKNVKKGELITHDNLRAIRPGQGCAPKLLESLLGKYYTDDFSIGTPMSPKFAKKL